MMPRATSYARRFTFLLGAGALFVLGMMSPATTRQGINFEVQTHRIPLYVKAVEFLDRDWQYRLIAHEVTAGLASDSERARALFAWTRRRIRPTPAGLPVIDDHILHIIIRGYGQDDQMADVFTTLSTYAGIPAFWKVVKSANPPGRLVLSFARLNGRWAVFDVANGLIFLDHSKAPADQQQLLMHPELIEAAAGVLAPGGIAYRRYLEALPPFAVPSILRAQKQMPMHRIVFEARKALRLLPKDERMEATHA